MPDQRSDKVVDEEIFDKYDRQKRLPIWNQSIINSAVITVVGAGGTGCEVLKNLALLGIGHLIIVDPDTVEFSNLSRQLFYTKDDVGKPKATVVASKIASLNSDVKVEAYPVRIQELPDIKLLQSDVILGCLDNWHARMYINSFCYENNIPLVDSATDGYIGRVRTIISGDKPCLACDNPVPPDDTVIIDQPCSLVGKPRIREHCAWKGLYKFVEIKGRIPEDGNIPEIEHLTKLANESAKEFGYTSFNLGEVQNLLFFHVPSVITVNAVVSGMQSQESLKVLFWKKKEQLSDEQRNHIEKSHSKGTFWIPDLILYTGLTAIATSMNIEKNPDCTVCGVPVPVVHELYLNRDQTVNFLLDELGFEKKNLDDFMFTRDSRLIDADSFLSKQINSGDTLLISSLTEQKEMKIRVFFNEKGT
ncbi:MAG: HesA/MoeB/ThiF family protein [Candidatus Hodarchaeales archaeon]